MPSKKREREKQKKRGDEGWGWYRFSLRAVSSVSELLKHAHFQLPLANQDVVMPYRTLSLSVHVLCNMNGLEDNPTRTHARMHAHSCGTQAPSLPKSSLSCENTPLPPHPHCLKQHPARPTRQQQVSKADRRLTLSALTAH